VSQENVEIVRRWLWAFENDRDAFREILHPEIEWSPFEEQHSPSHGIDGAMRIRDGWLSTWDAHELALEDAVVSGDEVVASIHITARGRTSGAEVDVTLHGHFRLLDEKVIYLYEHTDRATALEAVGL
jgi:ketosteroid isomerase-like protein